MKNEQVILNEIGLKPKKTHIVDYISGRKIRVTSEEVEAVQPLAKMLVEDFEYKKSQIQTHPQWRVRARPSDVRKEYPVDIAVFKSKKKIDDNLLIIAECKKKNRKDGRAQLEDYLRFSKAFVGIWFNGKERLFLRKIEREGKVYFEELPIIPKADQRLEDIGKFKRRDLKIPHNLKQIFQAMRNYLAGMAVGITRDEVLAQELMNVIFCKIFDERFTRPDETVRFRVGIDEDTEEVRIRILELFENVKKKYEDVFDKGDRINLDAKSLTYIAGELQNFCLSEAERDAVSDAFETFIGPALKGEQGQFFTPRNIIKTLVKLIDPSPQHLILDPACGSGGFLIESLRQCWAKVEEQGKEYGWTELEIEREKLRIANEKFRGIDKDYFLSKVAKAYMAIVGDGRGGIFCEDSLKNIKNWNKKTRQKIDLGIFDIVLTNPPFGSKIKVEGEAKLKQFDLAFKWKRMKDKYMRTNKLKESEEPQILFIERCLQFLKNGGVLGIVLPETFFHAPQSRYIIEFLKNHNIKAIIDLAHNTFRPYCNAKTMLLVVQKGKPQQKEILMAVAEQVGHGHRGKPIYKFDYKTQRFTDEIWDDTLIIRKEIEDPRNPNNCDVFMVNIKNIKNNIFVPRYYWKRREEELKQVAKEQNLEFIQVQELIKKGIIKYFSGHGSPPSGFKGKGGVPYIRVKDVVNWELYKDPTSSIPEWVYLKMKKEKELKEKDIVFVRRGSYRIGTVAMVSPFDKECLLTRELLILRVMKEENEHDINPYFLIYLLSHKLTQQQLFNKILIETTLPNIGDRWKELYLPITKDKRHRKEITRKIQGIFEKKWQAIEEIRKFQEGFSGIIT